MMLKKMLAKEIAALEEEIKLLEIKRSRSQAALIESLISHQEPDATDVEYFRTFTSDIDVKRDKLQKLTKELEKFV